jgi:cell division protein FtsB
MSSESDRLYEEEIMQGRKQIEALRKQNADLKDFMKHLNNEITSFLQYNSIQKEL